MDRKRDFDSLDEGIERVDELLQVPRALYPRILGKAGSRIQEMERISGSRITDKNVEDPGGMNKNVRISGTTTSVLHAKILVLKALQEACPPEDLVQESVDVEVPQDKVRKIVGKRGMNIQEIEQVSQTRITDKFSRNDQCASGSHVFAVKGNKFSAQIAGLLIAGAEGINSHDAQTVQSILCRGGGVGGGAAQAGFMQPFSPPPTQQFSDHFLQQHQQQPQQQPQQQQRQYQQPSQQDDGASLIQPAHQQLLQLLLQQQPHLVQPQALQQLLTPLGMSVLLGQPSDMPPSDPFLTKGPPEFSRQDTYGSLGLGIGTGLPQPGMAPPISGPNRPYSKDGREQREVGLLRIPRSCYRALVGQKGKTIQELEQRSGTKITDKDIPDEGGEEKYIQVYGTSVEEVLSAQVLVLKTLRDELVGPEHLGEVTSIFSVPSGQVRLVVGKGGSTIRDLENSSTARITDKNGGSMDPNVKMFRITGDLFSVQVAELLMNSKLQMGGK